MDGPNLEKVVEKLDACGVSATFEHPGYVQVNREGVELDFGYAGENFGGDAKEGDGSIRGAWDSGIPCKSLANVDQVVGLILQAVVEWDEGRWQR